MALALAGGAAYASGLPPAELLAAARAIRVASLIDFNRGGGGFMRGQHIAGQRVAVMVRATSMPVRRCCLHDDARLGLTIRRPAASDRLRRLAVETGGTCSLSR